MNILARDCWRAITERSQGLKTAPAQQSNNAQEHLLMQLLPIALKQDGDIMLAYLLRVPRVGSNASGRASLATDDQIRRTPNTPKGVRTAEGIALLPKRSQGSSTTRLLFEIDVLVLFLSVICKLR